MKKRVFAALCLIMLASLALSGCVGDKVPNEPVPIITDQPQASEELPDIKTVQVVWRGYRCIVPESFITMLESSAAYQTRPRSEQESEGLDILSYYIPGQRGEDSLPDRDELSSYSKKEVSEDFFCYNAYIEAEKYYECFAELYNKGGRRLVLTGMASTENGVRIFERIEALAAGSDIIAEPSEITDLEVTRLELPGAFIYGVEGIAYMQTDDADISLDPDDYELVGSSKDGITVYKHKTDRNIVLIDDPMLDKPIAAERADFWY